MTLFNRIIELQAEKDPIFGIMLRMADQLEEARTDLASLSQQMDTFLNNVDLEDLKKTDRKIIERIATLEAEMAANGNRPETDLGDDDLAAEQRERAHNDGVLLEDLNKVWAELNELRTWANMHAKLDKQPEKVEIKTYEGMTGMTASEVRSNNMKRIFDFDAGAPRPGMVWNAVYHRWVRPSPRYCWQCGKEITNDYFCGHSHGKKFTIKHGSVRRYRTTPTMKWEKDWDTKIVAGEAVVSPAYAPAS